MIYLDSAATTLQKPAAVASAMADALSSMSSPGRGGHGAAMRAAETAFVCRSEIADLFRVSNPENVIFTMNATHGLNIAIKSLVPKGGHVVISGYEHNAVTRPLAALGADIKIATGKLFSQENVLSAFERLITPEIDAVICNHVSNVFGFVQPVEQIAALCRERQVPFILDASQSAGMISIDMTSLGAAFIAMPGHKGLYGPQGTGILLCNAETKPLLEGGTGSLSVQQEMPDFLPDRLEAGTHNMPGIAGLLEGIRFIQQQGTASICHHERLLTHYAAEELRKIPNIQVYARDDLAVQTGVLSFTVSGIDTEKIGSMLSAHDIAVRTGMHCAPLAHRSVGTISAGTVRLSVSVWNTMDEIRVFLDVMHRILL